MVKEVANADYEDSKIDSLFSFDLFEYSFDLWLGFVFMDSDFWFRDVESIWVQQIPLDPLFGMISGRVSPFPVPQIFMLVLDEDQAKGVRDKDDLVQELKWSECCTFRQFDICVFSPNLFEDAWEADSSIITLDCFLEEQVDDVWNHGRVRLYPLCWLAAKDKGDIDDLLDVIDECVATCLGCFVFN